MHVEQRVKLSTKLLLRQQSRTCVNEVKSRMSFVISLTPSNIVRTNNATTLNPEFPVMFPPLVRSGPRGIGGLVMIKSENCFGCRNIYPRLKKAAELDASDPSVVYACINIEDPGIDKALLSAGIRIKNVPTFLRVNKAGVAIEQAFVTPEPTISELRDTLRFGTLQSLIHRPIITTTTHNTVNNAVPNQRSRVGSILDEIRSSTRKRRRLSISDPRGTAAAPGAVYNQEVKFDRDGYLTIVM